MTTQIRQSTLKNPVSSAILENLFLSEFDGTTQTFLEKDYRQESTSYAPLVVIYLHGAASHQDQGMSRGIYNGAFERWHRELEQRNAILICPEYRGNSWMGPAAEQDIIQIIRLINERYIVSKLILWGGSMGGTSALIFSCRFPEMVSGVIALCPATDPVSMFETFPDQFITSYGGSPKEVPEEYNRRCTRDMAISLADIPTAIVHGTDDAKIPVEHSRIFVERLRRINAPCLFIQIPDGNHDSPLQASPGELLDFVIPETVASGAIRFPRRNYLSENEQSI